MAPATSFGVDSKRFRRPSQQPERARWSAKNGKGSGLRHVHGFAARQEIGTQRESFILLLGRMQKEILERFFANERFVPVHDLIRAGRHPLAHGHGFRREVRRSAGSKAYCLAALMDTASRSHFPYRQSTLPTAAENCSTLFYFAMNELHRIIAASGTA